MPIKLVREEADRLHDLGIQCCHFLHASACEAASQSRVRWLVLPKLHVFHHMNLDLRRELWNPRGYHNFSGESYMKVLKAVYSRANTGARVAERVLKRTMLRVQVHQSNK